MRASSQRLLSFVISLALIIGAVLIYTTLISPSYDRIENMRSEARTLEKSLEVQEQNIKQLQELKTKFTNLEGARQVLALTLPNDPNIPQVVNTVQGLGSLNKIELQNLQADLLPFRSLGGPDYVRNVGVVRSRFSIEGTYDDFKKFIAQLEKNVRLMDVRELNVTANQGELKFDVVTDAYYQEALQIPEPKINSQPNI